MHAKAAELFSWQHQWREPSGAYWTGHQFELDIHWPKEQPVWTAGAVLLAADALAEATPACAILCGPLADDSAEQAQRLHSA